MKIEFSLQIFEKHRNTKFRENPSSGIRIVPCGRTDRRTDRNEEGNGHFSEFCDWAQKKGGNSLTRLLVESLLCDDVSFQLFKVSPKFQGNTIENNPPLNHTRQIFKPIQYLSLCLFDKHFNPLNADLNPICHLLALLGARPILHISRIRVKITLISAS
jgi:hypothetical protein